MTRRLPLRGVAVWLLSLSAATVLAEEEQAPPQVTFEAEVDTVSRFAWRGLGLTDGPAVQPSVGAAWSFLYAQLWSNLVVSDPGQRGRFTEVDPILGSEWVIGDFTLNPEAIAYLYPYGIASSSAEVSLGIAYAWGAACLTTRHAFDVWQSPGSYFGEMALAFEQDVDDGTGGGAFVSVSWANGTFNAVNIGPDQWALNVMSTGLFATFRPIAPISIRIHGEFSILLDPQLRSAVGSPEQIVAGIALGFSPGD